jgi:hypothetical protein
MLFCYTPSEFGQRKEKTEEYYGTVSLASMEECDLQTETAKGCVCVVDGANEDIFVHRQSLPSLRECVCARWVQHV